MNRRTFLRTAGVMGFATAAGPLVNVARAQSRTLKIGFIGAQSGMRANFGETTPWMIERIRHGREGRAEERRQDLSGRDRRQGQSVRSQPLQRRRQRADPAREVRSRPRFDADAALAVGELADTRSMPTISTMVPWTGWKFSRGATPDDLDREELPLHLPLLLGRLRGRQELRGDVEQREDQQAGRHLLQRHADRAGVRQRQDRATRAG